jgi:hypothetical protein
MIRIIFGLALAALAAGLVQVLFVAGDELPLLAQGGLSAERAQSLGLLTLLAATQSAVFAAPFAFLAAAIAAWQPIRSLLFFAGVGVAIAAAGFLAQYSAEAGPNTILNRYALAAYLASGLAGGLMYWLLAVPKKPKPAA